MKPIFISYRRDDNISTAKLLKAILESELGKDTVFLDTTTMGPGEKWRDALRAAVNEARAIIALIGPYWKGEKYWQTKKAEDNRLLNDEDWVRLELETALLDKGKKIIPMIFYPDKIKDFNDSVYFTKDTLPTSLLSLTGENNKAIIHEKQFEDNLKRTIIELSPFIKSKDILAELPLPDFDMQNPLDFLPESPFKGLDYFTEQDARIFFGRDEQIKELFYKLSGNSLVLFYGQSGVGKSSLLFAGLKRRMERKDWSIQYLRREPNSNLAEKLKSYVSYSKNSLVILDQIEEIYTNPSKVLSFENEKFQLIESIESALKKNIHILLSFREEYLAKIQELLDAKSMRYAKMPLRHMQVKGVLEAIEGITKAPEVKYNYNLSFEEKKDLPQKIAYLILNDKQSHVAPLLQLLLQKLWDRIADKMEGKVITEKSFDEVKSQSLNEMLNDQIQSLQENFSNEINDGLVLDLLYFFTTSRGTSASHTKEELIINYDYDRIINLAESLKNKYLLTGLQSENVYIIRLAHDSLAPIIREQYAQSNLPGQRASRLLDIKHGDIYANCEVEFSKSDLLIIDAGKFATRRITKMELKVIEESRLRIQNHDIELEEKNKQLELSLKGARAKALAATSRQFVATDRTIAIRLAEAACKATISPTKEAQSAFVDILRQSLIFYKQTFTAYSAIFSPDGQYVLTVSQDSTIELWNLDGTLKQSFGVYRGITSVAFFVDGRYILTTVGRRAELWNLNGSLLQSFEGHTNHVTAASFSPDGQSILTGSHDHTAKLWSLDGALKQSFKKHRGPIHSVTFSPDGQYILTGSHDHTAKLWNRNGTVKQSFKGHTGPITSVSFSPDGQYVLTGSHDTVKLWDRNGSLKQSFEGYSGAFSSDGLHVLTKSINKVRIWNLDGTLKQFFEGLTSNTRFLGFSKDAKSLLTTGDDHKVKLWNLEGILKQSFEVQQYSIFSVMFSPDGKYILTRCTDSTVKLWNLNGTLMQSFKGHKDFIYSATFSPDSQYILTASNDKTAKLWNLDGTPQQTFELIGNAFSSVSFSPDGRYVLTGRSDHTAKLWNLDGTLQQSFEGHIDSIESVTFSSDGQHLLTRSLDSTVKLWNLDGTLKQTFNHYANFSPDGQCVFEVSSDTVKLWNLDGTLKQSFEKEAGFGLGIFSPDGTFILTLSDSIVMLWNLDGTLRQTFKGHTGYIASLAFSPDGQYILTGSHDNTAKIWNLHGMVQQSFEGHSNSLNSATFSPDGQYVLTGSDDGTAKLWNPFWKFLSPKNIYVPSANQMKEYDIPEDIEWGQIW